MSIEPSANWNDRDALVCGEQHAITVFLNQRGTITIAQERQWDEDSDVLIVVDPVNALALAQSIVNLAGVAASELRVPAKMPTPPKRRPRPADAPTLFRIGGEDQDTEPTRQAG